MIARGAQAHQALMVGHLAPDQPAYRQLLAAQQIALAPGPGSVTAARQAVSRAYGLLIQPATLFALRGYVPSARILVPRQARRRSSLHVGVARGPSRRRGARGLERGR